MPRSSRPSRDVSTVPAHAGLLSADLAAWAGDRIARAGRREALLGRVEWLRLTPDGRAIEARVRGNRPLPYRIEVRLDGTRLVSRCTCGASAAVACKHAVAAMEALRFPLTELPKEGTIARRRTAGRSRQGRGRIVQPRNALAGFLVLGGLERTLTRDERVALAREEELQARRQRSRRRGLRVARVERPREGPLCFQVTRKAGSGLHEVTLRGPRAEFGSCTCADFADNELGTCEHVERVRRWLSRKKKTFPSNLLSCWWTPRVWTDRPPDPLCEVRIAWPERTRSPSLLRHFDEAGWLRPAPEGVPSSFWAQGALAAARRAARRNGLDWDLDPAVSKRIAAARKEERLRARLRATDTESPTWAEIVSRLGFRLHRYQETGALFLARQGRAFLADDMGLGKTVQSIVAALLLRRTVGAGRALIVCPASLKYQWRQEILRACGERAEVLEGPRSSRLAVYSAWSSGFLIVNYELVLRDLAAIRAAAADLVVLDEAQRIKNWDTKTARAVKRLESPYAFILTGTPLENRLVELHSLVEFLYPRALGPRWRLLPVHAVTEPHGRVIAYEGLDVLRRRLHGFFLRRERSAVLDQLPERTDNTFWTGMTAIQLRPYRRHAATVAALASRKGQLNPGDVRALLKALTRMRILCNAHAQYAWEDFEARLKGPAAEAQSGASELGSPKLEEFSRVLEDLLDESDQKIVVFSQWERMLRLSHFVTRDLLESRDLRAEIFHGSLSGRRRAELIQSFHLDPEFRVLLSTDAGGQGLNLQEAASIVVNLEVPWNPAVLEQRIGRVHRMGQSRSVQVLHFVTRGAIEERVRQVVEDKRALFAGLLVDEADHVELSENNRASFLRRVSELIDGPSDRNAP